MSASRRRSQSVPRKQSKREQRISDEVVVKAWGATQDRRGASFVDGCETTAAQGAGVGRGHFCGGGGAVS